MHSIIRRYSPALCRTLVLACAGLFLPGVVQAASGSVAGSVAGSITAAVKPMLESKARAFAQGIANSRWQVKVTTPGSAGRLAPCTTALTLEDMRANKIGRQRVKVSCDGFRRWALFVSGDIHLTAPVLVTAAPLTAGDRVSKTDVLRQRRELSELRRGYLTREDYLAGKTLRRRVRAGDVLTPAMFERAMAVRKGHRVSIRSGSGGLSVTVPGTVLDDGAVGDSVRVKNLSSGKTVYGVVRTASMVQVNR